MFKRASVQDIQPVTGLMSFGKSASFRFLPATCPLSRFAFVVWLYSIALTFSSVSVYFDELQSGTSKSTDTVTEN